MEGVKILKMSKEHIEEVLEIEKRCFTDAWTRKMFEDELLNPLAYYIVLVQDENIVGYAGFWDIIDDAQIMNVAVDTEYRGKGYGNLLIEEFIREAKDRNLDTMSLEVRVSNEPAIKLYEKYGFEIQGRRKKYYQDNGEDAYIMYLFDL